MNRQTTKTRILGIIAFCTFVFCLSACSSIPNIPQPTPITSSTVRASTATIISAVIPSLITAAGVIFAVLFGFYQWKKQHNFDREKHDEERFQTVVAGFGSERVEARVGAAILLLTFLRPEYEQFYSQTFHLAVSLLRLRNVDPNFPEPLDALSRALVTVLKESFPLARGPIPPFKPETLDATGAQLDNAYLSQTDLQKIRLRDASLRGAYFWKAQLQGAYLKHSNLAKAFLADAYLEETDLGFTNLTGAILKKAFLNRADLLSADLTDADFTNADLTNTHPENARSLEGTILRGVIGLSAAQLSACQAKGAIVDDPNSLLTK